MKKLIIAIAALAAGFQVQASGNEADTLDREILYMPLSQGVSRARTTSSSRSFKGESLEKYPTLDFYNSLTGVIPGLFQTENTGATGVRYGSENCTLWLRGFTTTALIVDDVLVAEPTQLQLNPQEIESITLVSDIVDKAKFGSEAAHGAIYVRTLGGMEKGRQIKFDFEKGIDMVDRLPEWVGGVDYATLNNQARANASSLGTVEYVPRFSEEDIQSLACKDPMDPFCPNVDWKSLMFKNTRDITKANFLIRGGGNGLKYSTNLGWANSGDVFAAGSASNFNRFNAKMNLDVVFNERLKANVSFIATYTLRHSPLSSGTKDNDYEYPTLLNLANGVPATEYPIYIDINEETGRCNYAVSNTFQNNPYASLLERGSYTESGRTGVTKATLDYDLGGFVRGLKSETQISYNVFYLTRTGITGDYMGYIYDPFAEVRTETSHDGTKATSKSQFVTSFLQGLQFHERLYHDFSCGGHSLRSSLTYYRSKMAYSLSSSYHKQQNIIFDLDYNYKGKYLAEAVLNYAGTSALKKGYRYEVFPSAGLGWVISREPWLENSKDVNYLKLRAQAGVLGNENYGTQYYWESYYGKGSSYTVGPYSANQWFGTSSSIALYNTTLSRYANDDLGWEKNHELNLGFDSVLWDHIELGYTYFRRLRDGIVVDLTTVQPSYFGPGTIMDNYNAYLSQGHELSLSLFGKTGKLDWRVGGFMSTYSAITKQYNEIYSDPWQVREGKPSGTIWGYDYLGRFSSESEIESSPVQSFDTVVIPGDLKYRDVNEDGKIDSHDMVSIGCSTPKLLYAVNIFLSYRNMVDLTVVGTGKAFYDVLYNNSYFWNGWGDANYSAFVRDNIGGAYPRLSYVKAVNNFQTSQFWMRDGSFFKIQNVELGFNIPLKQGNRLGIKGLRVYGRGANLLTVSGIEYVDPESMNAGVTNYPLFKTFTGGFKVNF